MHWQPPPRSERLCDVFRQIISAPPPGIHIQSRDPTNVSVPLRPTFEMASRRDTAWINFMVLCA
jgi:hypothetical protein